MLTVSSLCLTLHSLSGISLKRRQEIMTGIHTVLRVPSKELFGLGNGVHALLVLSLCFPLSLSLSFFSSPPLFIDPAIEFIDTLLEDVIDTVLEGGSSDDSEEDSEAVPVTGSSADLYKLARTTASHNLKGAR